MWEGVWYLGVSFITRGCDGGQQMDVQFWWKCSSLDWEGKVCHRGHWNSAADINGAQGEHGGQLKLSRLLKCDKFEFRPSITYHCLSDYTGLGGRCGAQPWRVALKVATGKQPHTHIHTFYGRFNVTNQTIRTSGLSGGNWSPADLPDEFSRPATSQQTSEYSEYLLNKKGFLKMLSALANVSMLASGTAGKHCK